MVKKNNSKLFTIFLACVSGIVVYFVFNRKVIIDNFKTRSKKKSLGKFTTISPKKFAELTDDERKLLADAEWRAKISS